MIDTGTISPTIEIKNGLADLRDPFRADCCESIRFVIRKNWKREIEFYALVEFQNGPTKGEQQISAPDFKTLVKKVDDFTNSLAIKP